MSSTLFSKFGLLVIENFFDAHECKMIMDEVRVRGGAEAMVTINGAARVDETARKAKTGRVDASTAASVKSRIINLMPKLEQHFDMPLTGCSDPQFLMYKEGDFFHPHKDNSHNPNDLQDMKQRRVSVVIFLNDQTEEPGPNLFGGGLLTFYGLLSDPRCEKIGFPLKARTGLLVAFASDVIHEVSPIVHGERFTVVSWFH